jgi:predicted  nucleic acid-binding Zn-ribbon protein
MEERQVWEQRMKDVREEVIALKERIKQLEEDLDKERQQIDGGRATPIAHVKKELNIARLTNLKSHVGKELFKKLKFMNDETLSSHPQIMNGVWAKLNITDENEKVEYQEDVVKEMKRDFSHRRSYCRKGIMEKYKSKKMVCRLNC